MKTKTLLLVDYCVDTETGNEAVGDIDHGIIVEELECYLMNYGQTGKEAIVKELAFLIYEVEIRWQECEKRKQRGGK
jgi:hypothetical protein